jgi:hypothetical protein
LLPEVPPAGRRRRHPPAGFAAAVPTDAEKDEFLGFLGTPAFASQRVFQGLRATRICDMESLGYCLAELFKGGALWDLHCPDSHPVGGVGPGWVGLPRCLRCCAAVLRRACRSHCRA